MAKKKKAPGQAVPAAARVVSTGDGGDGGGDSGVARANGADDAKTVDESSSCSDAIVNDNDARAELHAAVNEQLEMMRSKLVEAENSARDAELVARGKVSKAFAQIQEYQSRCADAEAAAEEERQRAEEFARQLTRVESALEEKSERLHAAEMKVSVLTAQVNLSPTTSTTSGANVDMLNSALAAANEKLKSIERFKENAEANETQLRQTVTALHADLMRSRENIRALETANEAGSRMQKQAIESGERVAKDLRVKLAKAQDELGELKRREAVRAATEHAAGEAVQRAEKFEFELKCARNQLADAEMALVDSENAVKALQFQLDIDREGSSHDEASARREIRLNMELDEARATIVNSKDSAEKLTSEVLSLREELENSKRMILALKAENNQLTMRADVAEKQIEINTLLGASANERSSGQDASGRLHGLSGKLDVVVAENQRLTSECKAAKAALKTAEDTTKSIQKALEHEREELDHFKRKARAMIDSKDREIDRLRSLSDASRVADVTDGMSRVSAPKSDDAAYVKTVVLQFLVTEEWQVQQSLLPTVVNVCGGSTDDLKRIIDIRAQFEPTIVHSAEVAINAAVTDGANAFTESLGLGRWF